MPLRDGIERHWVGMNGRGWYVGRRHAGGVVVTGPGYLPEMVELANKIRAEGHDVAIAEETITRSAIFRIFIELTQYR